MDDVAVGADVKQLLDKIESDVMETEYKGYVIVGDGTYGYKEIKPVGKGSVHLELRGSFTNADQAKIAIDRHLATKPAPKKKGVTKDGQSD